jgi:hypothetical protein
MHLCINLLLRGAFHLLLIKVRECLEEKQIKLENIV